MGGVYAMQSGPPHVPLTSTDAAGQTTSYTYDEHGRVETIETPPRMGLQPGETEPRQLTTNERTTTYEYYPDDAPLGAGRLRRITRPSTPQGSPVTTFDYDAIGRLLRETDDDGYLLAYQYDALDRLTRVTYPDATYEEAVYNRLDRERIRDRAGRWSYQFHDGVRRLAAGRDPLGNTTTFDHSGIDGCATCVDAIIDPNGNRVRWERDLQGRIVREIRADGATREWTYESATSGLKEIEDFKHQSISFEYNSDDTVKQVIGAGVSFTFDQAYQRVLTMVDRTGTTIYTYHPVGALGAGRVATIDAPGPDNTITYGYDEVGRIVSRSLNGAVHTRHFDSLGRVTKEITPPGSFTYTYHGLTNRLATATYPNGQRTLYSYRDNGGDRRLHEIRHERQDGTRISTHTYTYDTVGNAKTWTQQVGSDPDSATVWEYEYDAADRLVAATLKRLGSSPATLKRYRYAYDKAGNRTAEQLDDAVTGATYNNRNQLVTQQPGGALRFAGTVNEPASVAVQAQPVPVDASGRFDGAAVVGAGNTTVPITATDASGNTRTSTYTVGQTGSTKTFTYDANGSLISDGVRTFEWDTESHLTRVLVNGTETAHFVYDGLGRRVQKTAGGVTHSYIYDGLHVLEERLSTGRVIRYSYGTGIDKWLARQDDDGTPTYFIGDRLGSIVHHTDAAGQVVLTRTYDPWGNLDPMSAAVSGPAFTGRDWDAEVGLYQYRARVYDSKTGRFLSEDPIGLGGGVNFYAYVLNNPVNLVDPLGLESGNINQGFLGPYPPITWPKPCKPSCCMQKCLTQIFGSLPAICVMPNAAGVAPALGYAISGYRSIDLPVGCDRFFGEPTWVLHEYYHVLQQWERGRISFGASYVGQAIRHGFQHDKIPAEQEAEAFAQLLSQALKRCLDSCKPCDR